MVPLFLISSLLFSTLSFFRQEYTQFPFPLRCRAPFSGRVRTLLFSLIFTRASAPAKISLSQRPRFILARDSDSRRVNQRQRMRIQFPRFCPRRWIYRAFDSSAGLIRKPAWSIRNLVLSLNQPIEWTYTSRRCILNAVL